MVTATSDEALYTCYALLLVWCLLWTVLHVGVLYTSVLCLCSSQCFIVVLIVGSVLWREDLSVTGDGWNTYNVLVLPDLTNDGIPEVILPNGGDPKYEPEVSTVDSHQCKLYVDRLISSLTAAFRLLIMSLFLLIHGSYRCTAGESRYIMAMMCCAMICASCSV